MFSDSSPWVSLTSLYILSKGTGSLVLDYLFKDVAEQVTLEDRDDPPSGAEGRCISCLA